MHLGKFCTVVKIVLTYLVCEDVYCESCTERLEAFIHFRDLTMYLMFEVPFEELLFR